MNCGYLFSCGGRLSYLGAATKSALSIRKFEAEAKICLVHQYSELQLANCDLSCFDDVVPSQLETPLPERFADETIHFLGKIQALLQTPYERTLFLDSDTQILAPVQNLFPLLDRFDIAAAPAPMTQRPTDSHDPLHEIPATFPEFNSGVLLFATTPKVKAFLLQWKAFFRDNEQGLFRRHGQGGEQVSLRYILWKSAQISFYVLCGDIPSLYNFRYKRDRTFNFSNIIKIHHHWDTIRESGSEVPGSAARGLALTSDARPGSSSTSAPSISSFDECSQIFHSYVKNKGSRFYFIQIGANDGTAHDPIRPLIEKHQWRGILIEPVEHHFQRLLQLHRDRPGLIFENIAIAKYDGTIRFHYFPEILERNSAFPPWAKGMGSILKPFDSPGHRKMGELGFAMETREIPCVTLSTLIERHNVATVDLLQIDAEGFDGEIICNIDFALRKPKFICYEHRHIDRVFQQGLSPHSAAEVKSRLEGAGYRVFSSRNGFDTLCVLSEDGLSGAL